MPSATARPLRARRSWCPVRATSPFTPVQKATELGAKVVAMSDSNGYIYDPDGIKLDVVKQLKEVERERIKEYVKAVPTATYTEGCSRHLDGSLPDCPALRNAERNQRSVRQGADCQRRAKQSAKARTCPPRWRPPRRSSRRACSLPRRRRANAGGVAVSALEMSQNSQRLSWTFEEVDAKLKDIMVNIFAQGGFGGARVRQGRRSTSRVRTLRAS